MPNFQTGPEKLAKFYVVLLLGAGMSSSSTLEPGPDKQQEPQESHLKTVSPALITRAQPSLLFIEEGKLYFDAIPGSIAIFLNFEDLNERLIVSYDSTMDIMAAKTGPKFNISKLLPEYEATKHLLHSLVNFFSVEDGHLLSHSAPLFSRSWQDDPEALDLRSPSVLQDRLIHLQDFPSVTRGGTRVDRPEPRVLGAWQVPEPLMDTRNANNS